MCQLVFGTAFCCFKKLPALLTFAFFLFFCLFLIVPFNKQKVTLFKPMLPNLWGNDAFLVFVLLVALASYGEQARHKTRAFVRHPLAGIELCALASILFLCSCSSASSFYQNFTGGLVSVRCCCVYPLHGRHLVHCYPSIIDRLP